MTFLFKGLFRSILTTAVLVALATGGAVLIAGTDRTKAVFHKMHGQVLESIDEAIDDPTALRSQLLELEREYPERIAQVRGDLAELEEQIRQVEREEAISERVVALADQDLGQLEDMVGNATANATVDGDLRRATPIAFEGKVYSVERAQAKVNQMRSTRVAYSNRAADAAHDLVYLSQQAGRLEELLLQLENERSQFQAQIWQLSRQVDSIARNERLIHLLEKRNRTIEECSRYDVSSLDQITSRLSEIRSRQEAELDVLANHQRQSDYEEVARMQLRSEQVEAPSSAPQGRSVEAPIATASRR